MEFPDRSRRRVSSFATIGGVKTVIPGWSHQRAVQALEGNLWSMWSLFGRGPNSTLTDTPEVLAYETPLDKVPYNAVFRFRVTGDVDAKLDAVLALYRKRGVPLMWVVHPTSQPGDLRRRLADRGLALAEVAPGMILDLETIKPTPALPRGIEALEGTPDEVADWMQLVSWRYDLSHDSATYLRNIYRQAIGTPDPKTRWWVARRGGLPVSKAVLHVAGEVAGIYGVATRPEARGLGLASALTLHALQAARDQGCSLAVLHSTPMAVGMYRRLGFVKVADFEAWSEPGRVHL